MTPTSPTELERPIAPGAPALLDASEERRFDDPVRAATPVCDVPISSLSPIDADRCRSLSARGVRRRMTGPADSLCRPGDLPADPCPLAGVADDRVGPPVSRPVRRDGTLTLDRHGRIVQIDATCAAMLGTGAREAVGSDIAERLPRGVVRTLNVALASYACLWTEDSAPYHLANVRLVGTEPSDRRLDLTIRHVHVDGVPHTALTVSSVSVPQVPDRQLIGRLSQFRTLAELAPVGLLQLEPEGSCVYANDMWCKLGGFDPGTSIGHRWLDALHPDDVPSLLAAMRGETSGDRVFHGEFRLCPAPGEIVWVDLTMTTLLGEDARRVGSLLVVADITDRHRLTEQLHELAHKDTLTGLWNRDACLARLDRLLEPAGTPDHVAVLYVDLDGFKTVNDTWGHPVGDELLQAVATRLRSTVRPEDSVARLGGDEFAVLVPAVESAADDRRASAAAVAQRIVDSLGMPFAIAGREVRIGASVGIAIGDGHAVDRATLVKHADTALYAAKRGGRSRYAFFSG